MSRKTLLNVMMIIGIGWMIAGLVKDDSSMNILGNIWLVGSLVITMLSNEKDK